MIKKTKNIDSYDYKVTLVLFEDIKEAKLSDDEIEILKGCGAFTSDNGVSSTIYGMADCFSSVYLVHELIHATFNMFKTNDTKVVDDTIELFCYAADSLYKTFKIELDKI